MSWFFSSDQSANITALENALASSGSGSGGSGDSGSGDSGSGDSSGGRYTFGTGYFNNGAGIVPNNGYAYIEEYIPVTAGQNVYLYNPYLFGTDFNTWWATYDENKNPVGRINEDSHQGKGDNGRILYTVRAVPDGIAFVRVSFDIGIVEYGDSIIITTGLPEPEYTLADAMWVEGYVSGNGGISAESGCFVSSLIRVEAGAKYRFANSDSAWSNTWCGIGFYEDITEKFIKRERTAEFTVPDNAKYVRLSAQNMTGYCETATLTKVS